MNSEDEEASGWKWRRKKVGWGKENKDEEENVKMLERVKIWFRLIEDEDGNEYEEEKEKKKKKKKKKKNDDIWLIIIK